MSVGALPCQQEYGHRGAITSLWRCRDREVLIDGPAGTGKTRGVLEKVYLAAMKYPRMRALIVRKTRKSLTESVLVIFEDHVLPLGSPARDGPQRSHRQRYTLPNGSTIVLGGMDNSAIGEVMSTEYDLIACFEATELTADDIEKLTTRLRNGVMPYQQLICDCNPGPPSHHLKARADRGDMTRFPSRHEDNPRLYDDDKQPTPEGVKYLGTLDRLTGHRHARLRLGLWVAAEGVVYEEFDERVHVVEPFEIPKSWRRLRSIDFGYTNPFVCYDDQTEVMTKQGWRRFADLPRGLEVGTVNPDTRALEWQTPTAYIDQPYAGPMVGCRSRRAGVNFCVTPNHRMVIENRKTGRWSMPRADAMPSGGAIPTGWDSSLEDDTDAMLEIPRIGRLEMPPVSRVAFARFLGLWLADGCLSRSKGGFRVRVTQKARVPEVRAILEATGWCWSEYEGPNGVIDFSTNNISLFRYLEMDGGGLPSHEKRLPFYVFSWGRSSLEALIDGLLVGDGRLEQRTGGVITSTRALHTTSRALADGVQMAAALLGIPSAMRASPRSGGYPNPSTDECYAVRFHTSRRAAVEQLPLEVVEYVGRVYCVTVPNGTLVVRRNGHPMVCGNCQWWAIDGDGRMYLYREIYRTRRLVEDHARDICGYADGHDAVSDHDAEDRATLDRHGVSTVPALKDITPGIQAVKNRLRVQGDGKPRLFVVRGCTVERDEELAAKRKPTCTAQEFEAYSWAKTPDGKPNKEEPLDLDNHGMDAMRYAVMHEDGGGGASVGVVMGTADVLPTYDAEESVRLRRQYVDDFVMGRDLDL